MSDRVLSMLLATSGYWIQSMKRRILVRYMPISEHDVVVSRLSIIDFT